MAAKKIETNIDTETVEQPVKATKAESKFSKSQLAGCSRYRNRRDLVDALLDSNKKYTMKQVDEMIETFMKGKVM